MTQRIDPDYALVQRLLKSENCVRDVDALSNEELVSLYYVDHTHIDPVLRPKFDLIMRNVALLMRVYFVRAVEEGKLSRDR